MADQTAASLSQTGGTAGGGLTGGGLGATAENAVASPKHHENFRTGNVRFLQQQNKDVIKALEKLEEERDEALLIVRKWEDQKLVVQEEYARLKEQLAANEEKCNISAAEIHKRDEQIKVLSEQNRSLLDMLEQEETTSKERQATVVELAGRQERLQKISDKYDQIKETGQEQLTSAYGEIAKTNEELKQSQSETEQLRQAERNFAAQAKVDIEALEKKLADSKQTNVEHLQQIQHNEVHEHRLREAIQKLKETLDDLTVQKKGIKMQLDMDVDVREKWTQSKTEVERRRETLEKNVEALRSSLRSAEEQNQKLLEDNQLGADNFRQMGDKVYALMDQLRVNQLDLKKQEQAGTEKAKKIVQLDKMGQHLNQKLQQEIDTKLAAEAEARNAAQMQALLQKKNKMLDEALTLALQAQEKVMKRLQELQERATVLQTQNEYLGQRIDGQEEDKGALRYELRRLEDELRQAQTTHAQLTAQNTELEDTCNDAEAAQASLQAELDYIKREDMLDETGRTKPILIESESKLVDRLQINEFLFSCQQARNPIPMLVEKLSHLLEMIHTSQTQADLYLQDLQRSNSMLQALRTKNMSLYERVQLCETWKIRALLKIASNEFEARSAVKGHVGRLAGLGGKLNGHALYLDGLQYTSKELQELQRLIRSYEKQDSVVQIRLQDNQLDKSCLKSILELIDLCPYLNKIDLKRNHLDDDAVAEIKNFVERIPGVSKVTTDPISGNLTAHAGNQVRMTVELEDQTEAPLSEGAQPGLEDLANDVTGPAADKFLNSAAGVTTQTRLQGPDAPGEPAPSAGQSRTLLAPQQGALQGTTLSSSQSLPRIPSAQPKAGR
eukprot:gnl/TRDRNA2_/TRDRNA2_125810_c1_seq6.p1 gnl/TRDRNA2_/TRDRNA2_125810_c1~~gnl/TRDRNA2_/TRDRNA2_125810_c1_seq6.p1  ORF type:complete len:863 (-),score=249.88 gnl/TRDRNA2_/TRDRNA2_125810_c1_seq6:205-2733(-)